MNYAALPPSGDPGARGMIDALQKGFQLGMSPFAASQEMEKNKLANELQKVQLQYMPDMQAAELKKAQAMANLPFGGFTLPGAAGQVLGLESIKQLYGEGSDQYKTALQAFNLSQLGDQSRINYQQALTQTLPLRSLTPTGKSIVEQANVGAGLSPTGQAPSYPLPGGAQELSGVYDLLRQKDTTDVDTRKRNLFATNIEKTLEQINPSDLTQYAGFTGGLNKLTQQGLASIGHESEAYDKYQNALQAVEFLTSQVRQFYGDSIQPSMLERLNKLANPSTWTSNPKLAQSMFDITKTILGTELQTYRDALKSTAPYQDQNLTLNPTPQQENRLVKAGIASYGNANNDPLGIR